MQDLIKHLPAVIYEYTIHPDGAKEFTFISGASGPILGLTPEQVMADASLMDALIHPEDYPSMIMSSKLSEEQAKEWNWHGRMVVRGTVRFVEIRSNHERMPDNKIIRRGLIQDVTERRDLARETELRYQSLVERLPIGILIHVRGRVVFANSHGVQILAGSESNKVVGKDMIDFVHPEHRAHIFDRMKKVLIGEAAPMIEQTYVRLDGRHINVEVLAFPFTYKEEPAIQVIFRDITERKLAEQRMKKSENTLYTVVSKCAYGRGDARRDGQSTADKQRLQRNIWL
ncbi:MAG: PAS domain S-box protein [Bacteroidia bacterium]|nr:PAS domain S-box protein [Bacteroidia bacterium]